VLREFGYEGTTLSRITARTGLGKAACAISFPKVEIAAALELTRAAEQSCPREAKGKASFCEQKEAKKLC
jgi:hypothetical protein